MQGGCTCENASLLRIGTGNIEFAALFAPKPMGRHDRAGLDEGMSTKGFPDLRSTGKSRRAGQRESLRSPGYSAQLQPRHARAHLRVFQHALRLGLAADRLKERDYEPLTRDQLSVWDAQHPAPAGGPDFEKRLLKWAKEDTDKKLAADFDKTARPALEAIVTRTVTTEKAAMDRSTFKKEDRGDWFLMRGVVNNEARHESVPCLFFHPKKWNGRTVIWLSEKGKAALLDGSQPNGDVSRLLAAGVSVIAADLFMQGEFLFEGQSDTPVRKVKNPREAAAFTFGYNHSLFVHRIHDVLTLLAFVRDHEHRSSSVVLVALDKTAAIAAAARALSDGYLHKAVLDPKGVRLLDAASIYSPWFQPAAATFGDVPGLLKLGKGAIWKSGDPSPKAQTPVEAAIAE